MLLVEKSVLLPCSMDRAFRLFTARIDEWWPPERRHLKHPQSVIALSEDRFWESAPNGDAVELGHGHSLSKLVSMVEIRERSIKNYL